MQAAINFLPIDIILRYINALNISYKKRHCNFGCVSTNFSLKLKD